MSAFMKTSAILESDHCCEWVAKWSAPVGNRIVPLVEAVGQKNRRTEMKGETYAS